MCGISFIISKNKINIIKDLLNSLELIQNRGYDSMGICYYDTNNQTFKIEKNASTQNSDCFDILKEKFTNKNIQSYIGLGHTRWATHGGKTDLNSHPHYSENGKIILVHNGIINNFDLLKNNLINEGYKFYSETDSEVIANLIEYYLLKKENNIQDAIKNTVNNLEGTYALVIIDTTDNNNFYVTRKGSPLLIGANDNYIICTSETTGFNGLIYDYLVLNDNNILKINIENNYEFIKNKYNDFNITIKQVDNNEIITSCSLYKHWLNKEIMEQPETILKAYNNGGRISEGTIKLGGLDQLSQIINYIEHIVLIGCGTSYNAGLIGEEYFKSTNKFISVKTINACEFTSNDLPNIENKAKILTIFLSQSGETSDVYNCLKLCKAHGSITLGVINKVDSLIAREVMCGVYLNAGPEISVASTKSFTSMVLVLSLIQMWFSNNYLNNIEKINNLRYLSKTVYNMFYDANFTEAIEGTKDFIIKNNIENIFILGKNKLYPIACEGSLKIKEVTYIHCEGFSAGALKHGPFALLDKTNCTFLLIDYNDRANYQNLKSTYYELKGRNTNIIIITNSNDVIRELKLNINDYIMVYKLDFYNEIIFSIALQKLAYEISIAKNINPDKPKNLAKIVSVE
jgi:glucosamine--fructose-6-phosphate aminotransferase (isomerizing)